MKIKKTLEPSDITCVIDTREQTPLDLAPLKIIHGTLDTADYSLVGLTHHVAVERKSLQDLMMCVGRERERFDREVQRLLAYPVKALVIEAHISQVELKQYRGQIHPNAALGSVMGWMARGLPIIWAGDHQLAGRLTAKFLYITAKRIWHSHYSFLEQMIGND